MIEPIFFTVALIATSIAAYTDIRTREVPDWLNYSLIPIGLGLRGIYSLYHGRWEYILDGLLGLAVLFGFAYLMFYSGQWGGGDSKYIMGMGALLGIHIAPDDFTIGFLINTFLIGALYGLLWSVIVAVKNRTKFLAEWRDLRRAAAFRLPRMMLLALSIAGLVIAFVLDDLRIRYAIMLLLVFLFLVFYTFIFSRAVERSCMHRWVSPKELTEGDWIVDDVVVGKKRICGPKDLGISREQIAQLVQLQKKGKIRKVLMKVGIPFVPSFLIALMVTWFFGNIFWPAMALII